MENIKYALEVTSLCNIGKESEKNQDNLVIGKTCLDENPQGDNLSTNTFSTVKPVLFGVFDGMGESDKGEKASFLTAQIAKDILFPTRNQEILQEMYSICLNADERIPQESEEGKEKVGTTASMLCFNQGYVNLCNIGDSPIYCFKNGSLQLISEEHTTRKKAETVLGKEYTEDEKYPLTQCIGMPEEGKEIEPYVKTFPIDINEQYLICTDGLTDMVRKDKIAEILSSSQSNKEKVEQLYNQAMENGGKDNISIILIQVTKGKDYPLMVVLGTLIFIILMLLFFCIRRFIAG